MCRSMILALAVIWPLSAFGRSHVPESTWITGLKCHEIMGTKPGTTNPEVFPVYSIWLRGYVAGVSSAAPVSISANVKFSDFAGLLLTYCGTHPTENGVDAAVHVGSLLYNVLNPQDTGADLHAPDKSAMRE